MDETGAHNTEWSKPEGNSDSICRTVQENRKNPNKRSPSEQFQYVTDPPVSISVSHRRSLDVYHRDEEKSLNTQKN